MHRERLKVRDGIEIRDQLAILALHLDVPKRLNSSVFQTFRLLKVDPRVFGRLRNWSRHFRNVISVGVDQKHLIFLSEPP